VIDGPGRPQPKKFYAFERMERLTECLENLILLAMRKKKRESAGKANRSANENSCWQEDERESCIALSTI